ncbi:MAG: HAD family hydrolase [Lachnospiraceae bacterium]|nr:HAD family hydrolase [Lachnospiraceae bacterium]
MNRINTVIFDMDGTVLNTLEDLTDAVNHVFSQFDLPPRSIDEYRKFFGNGIGYAMKCAAPEGTPDTLINKMIPVFREYYDMHCLDKTKPYDGILELMKSLKTKGYKMAIVSNKIDSAVKELNDRFFSDYVSVAIGEKAKVRRKPAPDTVIAALKELHSERSEAVYIGDSEVDLQTSRNAGLPCIAVLWGFRDRDYLTENGAVTFAENPADVLSVLESC